MDLLKKILETKKVAQDKDIKDIDDRNSTFKIF